MEIGGSLRAVWITIFALGLRCESQGGPGLVIMLMSCLLKVPGPVCAPHEPLWEIGCLVARWEKLSPGIRSHAAYPVIWDPEPNLEVIGRSGQTDFYLD